MTLRLFLILIISFLGFGGGCGVTHYYGYPYDYYNDYDDGYNYPYDHYYFFRGHGERHEGHERGPGEMHEGHEGFGGHGGHEGHGR
jgi:hypothetical protein